MKKKQVQKIADKLNKTMSSYHSSFEPTDNEVAIALLLCHIDDLEKALDKKKLTMISIMHKSQRYTGFVKLTPGVHLTDDEVFEIVKHKVPVGSTFTPGG